MRLAALVLFSLLPSAFAQEGEFMENRWVAILSAQESFNDAKAEAEKLAAKARMPFSMEGRVFDKEKGLIYPKNFEDEVLAGEYVARRYNEADIRGKSVPYLSVERSDGYEGFKPGYYVVVAGVYETAREAEAQVQRFSSLAPTGYAKKTKIYMGCMH